MKRKYALLLPFMAAALLAAVPINSFAAKKDRVARDFRHADMNDDDKLSPAEWKRRGNFGRLDTNGDGFLSLKELRAMYEGHGDRNYTCRQE